VYSRARTTKSSNRGRSRLKILAGTRSRNDARNGWLGFQAGRPQVLASLNHPNNIGPYPTARKGGHKGSAPRDGTSSRAEDLVRRRDAAWRRSRWTETLPHRKSRLRTALGSPRTNRGSFIRDLKPANIKVRADGHGWESAGLGFGGRRWTRPSGFGPSGLSCRGGVTNSPTITSPADDDWRRDWILGTGRVTLRPSRAAAGGAAEQTRGNLGRSGRGWFED